MNTEILKKAIEKYGKHMQCMVAVEEMAELQKEVSKALRGNDNKNEMAEEIADVTIMMAQLQIMFGITDQEVCEYIGKRIERLERRMADEVL